MTVLLIILALLVLLALIRVGVRARYGEDGFYLWIRVFAFSIPVLPSVKDKPKKKNEPKKKPKPQDKPEKKKGGALPEFSVILEAVKRVLSRFRRKLSIDALTLHYVSANDDPFDAAVNVGRAAAGAAAMLEILGGVFKLKKYDVTTDVDFTGGGDRIFADATLTLAIWEAVYIALGAMPLVKAILRDRNKKDKVRTADGKVDNNGETPDK